MKVKALILFLAAITSFSCEKYREYDPFEVIENNFTGNFSVRLTASDVEGDYYGTADSGKYTFIWDNPSKGAVINLDNSLVSDGTMQVLMRDSRGGEVLNENFSSGISEAFSKKGKK